MKQVSFAKHLAMGLVLAGVLVASVLSSAEPKLKLTPNEKNFLGGLFKAGLWNPTVQEASKKKIRPSRVQLKVHQRSCWGMFEEVESPGWLFPADGKQPGFVVCDNLQVVPITPRTELKKADLEEDIRRLLTAPLNEPDDKGMAAFERIRTGKLHPQDEAVIWSAWLLVLGREKEAARLLVKVRTELADFGKASDDMRQLMAWRAFDEAANAYTMRADAEALLQVEHLLRAFPDLLTNDLHQVMLLSTELQRRQGSGNFYAVAPIKSGALASSKPWNQEKARKPLILPLEFEKWAVEKRVNYLIHELEEVDQRQSGQPGGVALGRDPRIQQLIQIGDPAIPALLDCFEKDERLTRSLHFWRDFSNSRTLLSVREAALTAIMSILRVSFFDPVATGMNYTSANGEEEIRQTTTLLRNYWLENGKLTLPERMMKVLRNEKADAKAWREAAFNLGYFPSPRIFGTMVWTSSFVPTKEPNPVSEMFSNPTAADLILTAMDRDPKRGENEVEDEYLNPLAALRDRRIIPEAMKRWRHAADQGQIRLWRKWTMVLFLLGEKGPLEEFARQIKEGRLNLQAINNAMTEDGRRVRDSELREAIKCLIWAEGSGEQALKALTLPKHPYHGFISDCVMNEKYEWENESLLRHPYCLVLLRQKLDDSTESGQTFDIKDDRHYAKTYYDDAVDQLLSDASQRRQTVKGRICDAAARQLANHAWGLPPYHPLLVDAENRLTAYRQYLDRFMGQIRLMSPQEARALQVGENPCFVPHIVPLDRAATPLDVAEGKAVFHLDGTGMPMRMDSPGIAILKADLQKEYPEQFLIIQREKALDGKLWYGLLGRYGFLTVREEKVGAITSIEATAKQKEDQ